MPSVLNASPLEVRNGLCVFRPDNSTFKKDRLFMLLYNSHILVSIIKAIPVLGP